MITKIFIEQITAAVFNHLLNQTSAGDRLNSIVSRATGAELDAKRRAFQNALDRTFTQFKASHPEWMDI